MKNKTGLIGVCAVMAFVLACSFSTAKLGELKFGKNDKASPTATSFDVGEKIFAVTETTGSMGTHKLKFVVTADDVAGMKKGEEALAREVDVVGNATPFLSFSVPKPGTYKVDVTMNDESGKEIDKKSGTVTVKGSAAPTPDTSASKTDADKDADSDEKKDDK